MQKESQWPYSSRIWKHSVYNVLHKDKLKSHRSKFQRTRSQYGRGKKWGGGNKGSQQDSSCLLVLVPLTWIGIPRFLVLEACKSYSGSVLYWLIDPSVTSFLYSTLPFSFCLLIIIYLLSIVCMSTLFYLFYTNFMINFYKVLIVL